MVFSAWRAIKEGMASTTPPPSTIMSGLRMQTRLAIRRPTAFGFAANEVFHGLIAGADGFGESAALNVPDVGAGVAGERRRLLARGQDRGFGRDGQASRECFQTAVRPAAAQRASDIHFHMAHFSGRSAGAAIRFSV